MSTPNPQFTLKFLDIDNERVNVAQDLLSGLIKSGESNPRVLAQTLKRKFDELYEPTWHCIVGNSFGSMVSHRNNSFLYFYVDNQAVLLFKSA